MGCKNDMSQGKRKDKEKKLLRGKAKSNSKRQKRKIKRIGKVAEDEKKRKDC